MRRAIRLLAASDKTRAELRERLTRAGLDATSVDTALDTLAAKRLLSDERVARNIAADQGVSRALNRHRLEQRGLDASAAECGPRDARRALAAARAIAARLPASLPPQARWRRLLASLARRGFDEEQATLGAESVLGPRRPPSDD